MICSLILGAESLESDLLQPGGISELHIFRFDGLLKDRKRAVFALRPDDRPEVESDEEETIERLTFDRLCRFRRHYLLGLQIKIGDLVNDYTPPDVCLEEGIESFSFSWRELFTRLFREERIAMTFYSRWLSHLKGDTIAEAYMSNVGLWMGPAEEQAMLWTEDQLAKPRPELARYLEQGMRPICRLIARRGRRQKILKDHSGMVDYQNLLSEQQWYRRSMPERIENSSAMGDYRKVLSDRQWYRDPMQRTTESPSYRPSITSSANWSDLSAASESETGPGIALPSHGPHPLSSSPAVQEIPQHIQQSEASGPSDMDVDLAPDPGSFGNPITPTKPASRPNQILPKAPNKLTRKFSEADLEEYTPLSKHPRLVARPETAAPESEVATVSLGALEAEMQRMRITPSLSWGNERRFTYDSEDFSGTCTGWMEITSTLASKDEDTHTYNSDDCSEAGTGSMEVTSSIASENEEEIYPNNS